MIYVSYAKILHFKKILLLGITILQKKIDNILIDISINKEIIHLFYIDNSRNFNNLYNFKSDISQLTELIMYLNLRLNIGVNKIDEHIIIKIKQIIRSINTSNEVV